MLGGAGRSWIIPVFILNGNFPDGFPQDEDPVSVDGNPHPADGPINASHPDVVQGWQHDLHGAAPHVFQDFRLNEQQANNVQEELQAQPVPDHGLAGWDAWPEVNQVDEVQNQNHPLTDPWMLLIRLLMINLKNQSPLISLAPLQSIYVQLGLILH
jgi:hypothetical protein